LSPDQAGPDRSVEGREPAGIRRLALLFDSGKAALLCCLGRVAESYAAGS
jgi:hypothetical protein